LSHQVRAASFYLLEREGSAGIRLVTTRLQPYSIKKEKHLAGRFSFGDGTFAGTGVY